MKQTSQIISRSSGASSTALALAANTDRNGFVIQNLGTGTLLVRMGAAATSLLFDYVLSAGTAASDGLGGVIQQFGEGIYMGAIYCTATTPSYVAFQF